MSWNPNNKQKSAWEKGQEMHFRQREQPGKSEKAWGADTEGTIPHSTILSTFRMESSGQQVCLPSRDPHIQHALHPLSQVDIISIMSSEVRESQRG